MRRSSSGVVRQVLLVGLVIVLAGCSAWRWRVDELQYPAREAPVPVFPSLVDTDLAPEAYAVGSVVIEGRAMDEVLELAAEEGRRHGADAVVLLGFEAMTNHWTATYAPQVLGDEVARTETVDVASSNAMVEATGLRNPEFCLGAAFYCDAPPEGEGCVVRVGPVIPGGPAEAAGLVTGNEIAGLRGGPPAHAWDVHQWADRAGAGGTGLRLDVRGPQETGAVVVTPMACAELYR
jgi:hypothetical protein